MSISVCSIWKKRNWSVDSVEMIDGFRIGVSDLFSDTASTALCSSMYTYSAASFCSFSSVSLEISGSTFSSCTFLQEPMEKASDSDVALSSRQRRPFTLMSTCTTVISFWT